MNLTTLQGYALSKLLYKVIIKELNFVFVLFPFCILVQTCLSKTTYEYVKRIVEYVGPRRMAVYNVYCCDFYVNKN